VPNGKKDNIDGTRQMEQLEIILAQPRGFCAGVKRAIKIVETALSLYDNQVWVIHEIVHNTHVIENLSKAGARFVEDISEVPPGSVTIFSAHGVSTAVEQQAAKMGLKTIDATCPLVKKVHHQAQRYAKSGHVVIIIGHHGHPEVEGTLGRVTGEVHVVSKIQDISNLDVASPDKLAYVTQTTLSTDDTRELIEALKERFPNIQGPALKDICYATQSRQDAVRKLSESIDILLVVGSPNSSNSNRLKETGISRGLPAYLVDNAKAIDMKWLKGKKRVGITAGASAPEILVQDVIKCLCEYFDVTVKTMEGREESMRFKQPVFPNF